MRRIRDRLARDDGFTLVEIAVGGMVATLLLASLGTFLMGSFETGAFTEGQSATLNDVRNVMQRMEKEIRGADQISWCTPAGACLQVGAQTPSGGFKTVRYTYANSELRRQEYNTVDGTWSEPLTMVERVANSASQPIFVCDTQSTLLRVSIDLHISPTPQSDPKLNVNTSIRPRNFPERASCP